MNQGELAKATVVLYRMNMLFVKLEEIILGVLFFILIGAMVTQVACRYIFLYPTPWAEELSRYLFIWIAYVGGAYATFYWDHIEINLVDSLIKKFSKDPERAKWMLNKISIVLSVLFLIVFANIYSSFLLRVWNLEQHSAAMGMNMILPMSSAYIGAILMIFHGLSILFLPKSIMKPPSWK